MSLLVKYPSPSRNKKTRTKILQILTRGRRRKKGGDWFVRDPRKEGGARPGLPCLHPARRIRHLPDRPNHPLPRPIQSNPPPNPHPPTAASPSRSGNPLLRSCAEFRWGHFGSNSGFRRRESNRGGGDGTVGPRGASRGVDAASTGPWIAEPSGVTRTTAGAVRAWPPPRRRPPSPGRPRHPRPRRPTRRRTQASARRCFRRRSAGRRAAPRARASPSRPSGACSGRTPTGRSSPRSSSSSPVIQVTRMMNIWILAYAQSCKYRRAESPAHLSQVESTGV